MAKPKPKFAPDVIARRRKRTWRWDRVESLGKSGRKPTKADDADVVRGLEFWTRWKAINEISDPLKFDEAEAALDADFFDCRVAFDWFSSCSFERWAVESLVVANEDRDRIALEANVPVEVVRMYEALFFDVRDRLGCEILTRGVLFAPAVVKGSPPTDHDLLWKHLAFERGAPLLRSLWSTPELDASVTQVLHDIAVSRIIRNAAAAQFVRAVTKESAGEITQDFIALKAAQKEASVGGDQVLSHLLSAAAITMGALNRQFENTKDQALLETITMFRNSKALQAGTKPEVASGTV